MNKPKPYTLTFRLRSPKHTLSTYQEVYMLLRVGTDKKVAAITGYRVERAEWFALEGQQHRSRNFVRSVAIETRLDAIRDKIDTIYRYQARRAQIEHWQITTCSVLRQFQGLLYLPVKPRIQPCVVGWQVVTRSSVRRAALYA